MPHQPAAAHAAAETCGMVSARFLKTGNSSFTSGNVLLSLSACTDQRQQRINIVTTTIKRCTQTASSTNTAEHKSKYSASQYGRSSTCPRALTEYRSRFRLFAALHSLPVLLQWKT